MAFFLELITPERSVYRQEVDQITLPTVQGEITILQNHLPLVSALVPGIARVVANGVEEELAVAGGFLLVEEGGRTRILADSAERGHELDMEVLEEARARAEKIMAEMTRTDDAAYAAAAAQLEHELARYKVAIKHRKTKRPPVIGAGIDRAE
ncbi:ATP synthase F1 subunit epsilon [Patescibacteria group bacterium]|nr:ATP synthase F1 subunit epsilon [Patescibacteria group bacterium]MBU1034204.1 ATP synthase F1 subunit epsilon [Patescibacteria group bacterium]MBU1629679.1 ATP synthase F1 subunit epsilon [Patescibacteria group bacterium]MBU1907905.1 ATP synthase F1 subunit epsilon [Patescibacteria group bacterium]